MEERKLTFGEHLEELRMRVLYSILAIVGAFVACWVFSDRIMLFLAGPHRRTMRAMHLPEDLKVLNYTEAFMTYMKVCLVAALFIAAPFVVYQIWKFISEGLYEKERRYVHYFAPASLGLFMVGMLFGFYVLIPFGLRFLLAIGGPVASPLIRMEEYVSLLVLLTLVVGLIFELPLVMFFVFKIGMVTAEQFREQWRYAYFAIVVLAAIISPTGDPVNLSLVSLPMIGLYELGILLCKPSLKHFLTIAGVTAVLIGSCYGAYYLFSKAPTKLGVETAAANGPMQYRATSDGEYRELPKGSSIIAGMTVRTEFGQRSRIEIGKGAEIRMNAETELRVVSPSQIFLERGEVMVTLPKERASLSVATSDGETVGREGKVDVRTSEDGTRVIAVKGEQMAVANGVRESVTEGRSLSFRKGGEPVDVKRATRWAEF